MCVCGVCTSVMCSVLCALYLMPCTRCILPSSTLTPPPLRRQQVERFARGAAAVAAGLCASIASSGYIARRLAQPTVHAAVRRVAGSPVGPFTVFFWAPASKVGRHAYMSA